ncbi:MAG TPA: tryptophan-rich sensory protein [Clostridiales bacterium]|nr:tryptophan-rich sensory protein [Clostridiales bacterium]
MKKVNWFDLLEIVLITELIGILGSLLSGNNQEVYTSFRQPPLAPPGWVFGIIWPILYLLMAIAAYCILQIGPHADSKAAMVFYWAQLIVNFFWPIVFFRLKQLWLSVGVIVLLDILVILTIMRFRKLKITAGNLMIPYLLWILFATYLNIGIAVLN